jgi:hypothetical protein
MPEAKLPTKDYLPIFAKWRNEHYNASTSTWSTTGSDFLPIVNKACKDLGNAQYSNDASGYDALRAKHNSTRTKYKKVLRKPIDASFNIGEYKSQGVGRPSMPDTTHLSATDKQAYMVAISEADETVATKMPGLPPYSTLRAGSLTGKQMGDLLD